MSRRTWLWGLLAAAGVWAGWQAASARTVLPAADCCPPGCCQPACCPPDCCPPGCCETKEAKVDRPAVAEAARPAAEDQPCCRTGCCPVR